MSDARRDRSLSIGFWALMVGLFLVGIIGLFTTPQIAGIG